MDKTARTAPIKECRQQRVIRKRGRFPCARGKAGADHSCRKADASAGAKPTAESFGKDANFLCFYRAMKSYETTFGRRFRMKSAELIRALA